MTSSYRYIQNNDGSYSRVTNDEAGRVFQGTVVKPRKSGGTSFNYVPETIDNSEEAIKNREKYSYLNLPLQMRDLPLQRVYPEFDILSLGRMFGLPNHIGNWYPKIPNDPNRYYRIVGRGGEVDPIADAVQSGVIRGPGMVPAYKNAVNLDGIEDLGSVMIKAHDYPMFAKGAPWKGSTANVSKSKPTIIRSKADQGDIVWQQSNIDFRHKGHEGIFRPTLNGDPNAAPSQFFEYFEPARFFGYNRYDIVP